MVVITFTAITSEAAVKSLQSIVTSWNCHAFTDVFTTVVDLNGRWLCLGVLLTFLTSWTLFSTIYYLTAWAHGDLADFDEAIDGSKKANSTEMYYEQLPCIMNGRTFMGMMLFSLETQATIGYGHRFITEKCPVAIAATFIQSVLGVLIEACIVAVIIAKFTQPKLRAKTLLFSSHAVISLRNGKLCLMFRVGDMRTSHLINANIRLLYIRRYETMENEVIPFYQIDLPVSVDQCFGNQLFLSYPVVVVHEITAASPLYDISQSTLSEHSFELLAILEGTTESTGLTTQARTSYSTDEIIWGHRFEPLFACQSSEGAYKIDYNCFNSTYDVPTPKCSAKDLKEKESETVSVCGGSIREQRSPARPSLLNVLSLSETLPSVYLNDELENIDEQPEPDDSNNSTSEVGVSFSLDDTDDEFKESKARRKRSSTDDKPSRKTSRPDAINL